MEREEAPKKAEHIERGDLSHQWQQQGAQCPRRPCPSLRGTCREGASVGLGAAASAASAPLGRHGDERGLQERRRRRERSPAPPLLAAPGSPRPARSASPRGGGSSRPRGPLNRICTSHGCREGRLRERRQRRRAGKKRVAAWTSGRRAGGGRSGGEGN
jgi:hypothetical protein